MNKQELSQLYYLNKEIELIKQQIQETDCIMTQDSVKGSSVDFPYTQHSIKIYGADIKDFDRRMKRLKNRLSRKLSELMDLRDEINEYIESISDSKIRMILTLRYVNGLNWRQIAFSIGGNNTEESVKKAAYRFLKEN